MWKLLLLLLLLVLVLVLLLLLLLLALPCFCYRYCYCYCYYILFFSGIVFVSLPNGGPQAMKQISIRFVTIATDTATELCFPVA